MLSQNGLTSGPLTFARVCGEFFDFVVLRLSAGIDDRGLFSLQAVRFSLPNAQRKMADEPNTTDQETAEQGRIARLIRWASTSRLRMALVGSFALVALVGTFALWSYLAQLAVNDEDPATLARALEAMDSQNFEEARNIVGKMRRKPDAYYGFGASLFVLGAVKAEEAKSQWSAERSRAIHLLAARYLEKARSLGVPAVRENQLNFLLGQSLILGNQPQAGIDVLKKLLDDAEVPTTEIHALLSEAYLATVEPDLESALKHNQAMLKDDSVGKKKRAKALITQAGILRQLGRLEEAREQLIAAGKVVSESSLQALTKSVSGQLAIAEAERLPKNSEERTSLLNQALADLREAQRQDPLNGELTRQAMVWIGRCYEAMENIPAAIDQYGRIGKLYGDTPESIVASLAKADADRVEGNLKLALAGYRSVLESVGDPVTYVNYLLPLSELRKRLLLAHASLVERKLFEDALAMVDRFSPVFGAVEVTQLRGLTHKEWGMEELEQALKANPRHAGEIVRKGRHHLRAAGRAYEALAQLRFATRQFTEDLWESAENYYQGQSYTHATRVLEQYLHHEARRHKARALLRLGQSLLATNRPDQAIEALEECIEMYPRDGDVYQARLDCVHAYRQRGDNAKAEELLLTNLNGDQLMPSSPEWRDSLFTIGELLHDSGRYDEAIRKLDEAVSRYPEAPQALLARYTIARSYYSAAEEPAEKIKTAKTENERQKSRKLRDQNLDSALQNYLVVQRMISLDGQEETSLLKRTLLRNCYMMQGSVLFQLKQYEEARKAYSNVSTLYQDEPFVLESFVHIANCWRRLNQPVKARGTIEQAKLVLGTLPPKTDFRLATNFNRQQWKLLLDEMSRW